MDEITTLVVDDTVYATRHTRKFAGRRRWSPSDPGKVLAYLPGVIRQIHVSPGQRVARGQALVVLEAMKMKNDLTATAEGEVKAIHVSAGQMVTRGQLILELGAAPDGG